MQQQEQSVSTSEAVLSVVAQFSLKGKVAVVTGGARGLGYEMMLAFAESGAAVACIDLLEESCTNAANKVAAKCNVDASSWPCDVTDNGAVVALFEKIIHRHKKIDILVTAAGINKTCPAIDYTPKDFFHIFDVNVNGTFYCMQQAAKHMIRLGNSGSIITIASMSADIVNRSQCQAPYNASKAAVKHLTKSLAGEWAPYRIRVNTISPGYFETAMTQALLVQNGEEGADLRRSWERDIPMGRMGQPHELKGLVVYLASDSASYVTGSEILVDGGYTLW